VTREEGVLVQGITGRQGRFWTERMVECGTRVVAGVSPGKGGTEVCGVPVYDSVSEAIKWHDIRVAVLFTPAKATKGAALESLMAGVKKLVLLAEGVPVQETMEILAEAREAGAQVLGPNTAGVAVPGEAMVGIIPAFIGEIFRRGEVGVVSRSGSLGTLVCMYVSQAGLGQSAFIGVGGDPVVGTTMREACTVLEEDERTRVVVLVGEIGGSQEEDAAEYVRRMRKPVVAVVVGREAPRGKRMGHAGAIVLGERGSAQAKMEALRAAGARVAEFPWEVGGMVREALRG